MGAGLGVLQRLPPSQILVHWLQEFGKERKSRGLSRTPRHHASSPRGASLDAGPCSIPPPALAGWSVCTTATADLAPQPQSGLAGGHREAAPWSWGHPPLPVLSPHNFLLRLLTASPSLSHLSAVATGSHIFPWGFSAPCSPPGIWCLFSWNHPNLGAPSASRGPQLMNRITDYSPHLAPPPSLILATQMLSPGDKAAGSDGRVAVCEHKD